MLADNLITGAAVFRKRDGSVQWLVIKPRQKETWELPKGPIRRGESSVSSIIRMLREDAGLIVKILDEVGRIGGRHRSIFYLATSINRLSRQTSYEEERWLPYKVAHKILATSAEKKILRQANAVFSAGKID